MTAVVLLLPKASYVADDFLEAARVVGLEVLAISDRCEQLAALAFAAPPAVHFRAAQEAAEQIAAQVAPRRPRAVVGVDDQTALVAALAAARLGLPHNPPEAVARARNKARSRSALRAAGLRTPRFEELPLEPSAQEFEGLLSRVPFPCVVKPLVLSASRGVIRADDPEGLRAALARVAALLRSPQVAERRDPELQRLLVEEFVPGPEVAVEGLLAGGRLHLLALFDKPDPLDGPFFEETLYVTPSRHPAPLQDAVAAETARACTALGLVDGPIHAELRLSPDGPVVLEVAARTIGGLCGRALRFGVGIGLPELVLRHALGQLPDPPARERSAAGVLMLPIRERGVLESVEGLEQARAVPGIVDLVISARAGDELVPLPEGASYLGFAFARGPTPDGVEQSLRAAGARVRVRVAKTLPVAR